MKYRLSILLRVLSIIFSCILAVLAIRLRIDYWEYSAWWIFTHATKEYLSLLGISVLICVLLGLANYFED